MKITVRLMGFGAPIATPKNVDLLLMWVLAHSHSTTFNLAGNMEKFFQIDIRLAFIIPRAITCEPTQ
jgi:hypothetical protein